MINYFKYFLILLLFFQCSAQENKMEEGEWVQITMKKQDTIIYNSCHSENRKIIIRNDSLIDFNGQEVTACKILSFFPKKDWKYIILEKNCSYSDTIRYKKIGNDIIQWKLYNDVNFYSVLFSSRKRYKVVDEKCNDEQTTAPPNQEKKDIFLYNFLKEGITSRNVVSAKSKSIIEGVLGKYTNMNDYGTTEFYNREGSKITNYNISSEQEKIWNLCWEKLNFEGVANHDELESDWRYPYNKLVFAKKIMDLYKDTEYGDSWQHISTTLKYHIALYMYYLPWKERKLIYEELDSLRKELQNNGEN